MSAFGDNKEQFRDSIAIQFPGAFVNFDDITLLDAHQIENLINAGFEPIEVIYPDGTPTVHTYAVAETPQTRICDLLMSYRECGWLFNDPRKTAINMIMDGTFDETYSKFYPGLQG